MRQSRRDHEILLAVADAVILAPGYLAGVGGRVEASDTI